RRLRLPCRRGEAGPESDAAGGLRVGLPARHGAAAALAAILDHEPALPRRDRRTEGRASPLRAGRLSGAERPARFDGDRPNDINEWRRLPFARDWTVATEPRLTPYGGKHLSGRGLAARDGGEHDRDRAVHHRLSHRALR